MISTETVSEPGGSCVKGLAFKTVKKIKKSPGEIPQRRGIFFLEKI